MSAGFKYRSAVNLNIPQGHTDPTLNAILNAIHQLNAKMAELLPQVGVPSASYGKNGQYYFRSDGGAGTHIYFKAAGAWTAIV